MRCHGLFLASCIILFCVPSGAQESQSPSVIKVNTELVVRTVSVKDAKGYPVGGLTAGDFVVSEDGVLQTLSVFEFHKMDETRLPSNPRLMVADGDTVKPRPATESAPGLSGRIDSKDRRLLAFYFDFASMLETDRARALNSAQEFIDRHMTFADHIAVLTYSQGAVRLVQEFTNNRDRLLERIQELRDRDHYNERLIETQFGQNEGVFDIFSTDRRLMALQTVTRMFEFLREAKSLIYFASGAGLNVGNLAQLHSTLNAAVRSNVSIYPIDSRGLSASAPMGGASQPSAGGIGMYSGAVAMNTMREFQRSQDTLYALAADTGGRALLDSNDLTLGIVQAQRAASSYYVLGYYPKNTARDGRVRRIRVLVKDRSVDLSYRRAYYAGKDFSRYTDADKERQLEDALLLEDPISELPIAVELNYFQMSQSGYFVPLSVNIPGSELTLAQEAGADHVVIDFIGEIRDVSGTTVTNLRDKVEIELKNEIARRLASRPVHYDTGFTLTSGRYMLKFLVRNAVTGKIGTYQRMFIVPDLSSENLRLPISSVVVSSQRIPMSDALFSVKGDKVSSVQQFNPLVQDGQKLVPNIMRVFNRAYPLYVYFEAYAQSKIGTDELVTYVSFYRGQEKIFETPAYEINSPQKAVSGAIPAKLKIALDSLPAGEYTCQVTALHPKNQKVAFWQTRVLIVP